MIPVGTQRIEPLSSRNQRMPSETFIHLVEHLHKSGLPSPVHRIEKRSLHGAPRHDLAQHHPGLLVTEPRRKDTLQRPVGSRCQFERAVRRRRESDDPVDILLRLVGTVTVRGDKDLQLAADTPLPTQLFGTERREEGNRLTQFVQLGQLRGEAARGAYLLFGRKPIQGSPCNSFQVRSPVIPIRPRTHPSAIRTN